MGVQYEMSLKINTALLAVLLLAAAPAAAQEPLTLDEALRLALQQNYEVRTARNQLTIAANNYSVGAAGFLPSLALTAGYNGTLSNTNQSFLGGRDPLSRTGALTQRQNAGASFNWTVFDGLGTLATYRRLGALRTQQEAITATTVEAVMADVIVGYFAIVQQQEQTRVFAEAVALSEERVRIAELRLDLGSASELEVRLARVDLNADRAALLRQEAALANAKATFNQLLARPATANFVAADSIALDPALSFDALRTAALAQNPSLQAAEEDRTVAALSLREVQAERFPRVNLAVGYGFSNLNAESGVLATSRNLDLTYGLSLSYNLFDGFDRRRRSENASVQIRNAELAVEDLRTQIEADLTGLQTSYETALSLIALEQENLGFARSNVDIALERFRLGTITSVELREVQETLTQAQSRLIAAQFEAKRTETELLRLSGTWQVQ
jgi:outer membrane protein